MVNVVGRSEKYVKRTTCFKCASILEYTENELDSFKSYDYAGGCDINYFIKCPICGDRVVVSTY